MFFPYSESHGNAPSQFGSLQEPYAALRTFHPRSEARLLVSMQALGQKTPLIVIHAEASGAYVVVDGHKRLRVLRRLKADVADVLVWARPAAEALAASYRMQDAGAWSALEEGALIEELHRDAKWSLQRIAQELDRTEGWVSRRLGLIEGLSPTVRQAAQQGRLGVYSAVTYLLPLTRVKPTLAEQLAVKLKERPYTTRQVRLLCAHCLKGPAAVAERIVQDPETFLKSPKAMCVWPPRRASAWTDGTWSVKSPWVWYVMYRKSGRRRRMNRRTVCL